MKIYNITPVAKPRMTRSDKWKKRKCVVEYFAYKDEVRHLGIELPEHFHVIFVMPMPKSWPQKKRLEMAYMPHKQRPDVDNLTKGLLDSLYDEDSHIWDGRTTKIWGGTGMIIVTECAPFELPFDI